jgi:hypothetical protein
VLVDFLEFFFIENILFLAFVKQHTHRLREMLMPETIF